MTRPRNPFAVPIGCERPHARLTKAILWRAEYNAECVAIAVTEELLDYDGV